MLLLETELQIKYDIAVVLRKRYGDYEVGLRKFLLYVELRVNNP